MSCFAKRGLFPSHILILYKAKTKIIKGVTEQIARKHNNRLHLFNISTLAEANLLDNKLKVLNKRITAEACIHHLWFSDKDYQQLGANIKWNPSIKTKKEAKGLLQALLDDRLDFVATDHAPHTKEEKTGTYFQTNSGGPLVQHALVAMLEMHHQEKISLEKIVEKMCHRVAEAYRIKERGYVREGYYADLVLIDLHHPWKVSPRNLLFKCNWSPFSGQVFRSSITHTWVNGTLMYENGKVSGAAKGRRLTFEKAR